MSCWETFLGPSPSASLTSGSAHRLWPGHCSGPGGWHRGMGRGTSATVGRAKCNRQRQGLALLNQSPSADFSGQRELHTVELERLNRCWPVAPVSQVLGRVASVHLGPEGAWPHSTSEPQTSRNQVKTEPNHRLPAGDASRGQLTCALAPRDPVTKGRDLTCSVHADLLRDRAGCSGQSPSAQQAHDPHPPPSPRTEGEPPRPGPRARRTGAHLSLAPPPTYPGEQRHT